MKCCNKYLKIRTVSTYLVNIYLEILSDLFYLKIYKIYQFWCFSVMFCLYNDTFYLPTERKRGHIKLFFSIEVLIMQHNLSIICLIWVQLELLSILTGISMLLITIYICINALYCISVINDIKCHVYLLILIKYFTSIFRIFIS